MCCVGGNGVQSQQPSYCSGTSAPQLKPAALLCPSAMALPKRGPTPQVWPCFCATGHPTATSNRAWSTGRARGQVRVVQTNQETKRRACCLEQSHIDEEHEIPGRRHSAPGHDGGEPPTQYHTDVLSWGEPAPPAGMRIYACRRPKANPEARAWWVGLLGGMTVACEFFSCVQYQPESRATFT